VAPARRTRRLSGPDGYGEIVNGGDYAYVIREDGPGAPPQFRPPRGSAARAWASGPNRTPERRSLPEGPSAAARSPRGSRRRVAGERGRTARTANPGAFPRRQGRRPGAAGDRSGGGDHPRRGGDPGGSRLRGRDAQASARACRDPALAYGPDDPAYGPPGPDWYKRDEERAPGAEDAETHADAGEPRVARGPFEPLRSADREEAGHADYQPADGDAALDDPGVSQLETEIPEYESINYEMSELLDFGTPTDPEAGALGQVKDLYETAETVSQATFDRHFEQLLERQRELISEYFNEPAASARPRPRPRPWPRRRPPRRTRRPRSASPRRKAWPACAASCAVPREPRRAAVRRTCGATTEQGPLRAEARPCHRRGP